MRGYFALAIICWGLLCSASAAHSQDFLSSIPAPSQASAGVDDLQIAFEECANLGLDAVSCVGAIQSLSCSEVAAPARGCLDLSSLWTQAQQLLQLLNQLHQRQNDLPLHGPIGPRG